MTDEPDTQRQGADETLATAQPSLGRRAWQSWRDRILVAIFLLGLGIVGLGLENVSWNYAAWYWGLVLPLFGIISIRMSARRPGRAHQRLWPAIRQQILHWIGFFLALSLMFMLEYTGTLNRNSSGLVSLLLLTVATYYAGIHLDRSFLLASFLLAVALCVASYIQEYLWIMVVALAVVAAALYFGQRYLGRRRGATQAH